MRHVNKDTFFIAARPPTLVGVGTCPGPGPAQSLDQFFFKSGAQSHEPAAAVLDLATNSLHTLSTPCFFIVGPFSQSALRGATTATGTYNKNTDVRWGFRGKPDVRGLGHDAFETLQGSCPMKLQDFEVCAPSPRRPGKLSRAPDSEQVCS